jgi:transitional endoplasmic reticulum ATPase
VKSRQAILQILLQKSPVASDVDLTFLARILNGASGADIAELCQRACKMAIRESIENDLKMEQSNSFTDSQLEIRRDHFEQAIKSSRCLTSSGYDISKYEMFGQIWQPSCSFNSSFRMPVNIQNSNADGRKLGTILFLNYVVA